MQKLLSAVVIIFLLLATAVAEEWEVIKSEHFLVYYLEDKAFAKEVSKEAEKYYDRIAADLGYPRYDKFWQWENRVKIYLYRTHEEFLQATGKPKWVNGTAFYNEKKIVTYRWNKGFLHGLLPHELTHLIFRDFVGFPASGGGIPLWIDEGVAQWEERDKRKLVAKIVKELIKEGDYIPLSELVLINVADTEKNYAIVRKFYVQSVSLVGYLMNKYSAAKFTLFCRQLRDGKSVNEALSFTYTNSIRNINELEEKWIEYYKGGR